MTKRTGTFRKLKSELREQLGGEAWRECLASLAKLDDPREYVGPLMALLPQSGFLHWRGILGMGIVVPALVPERMEEARIVMRRLMWHMNEESGNIGWGISESMAEIMSNSPELAREFGLILFSYILDSGREDNYIDHAPLLRSCFWAAGRFAQARPDLGQVALPSFVAGLDNDDAVVRVQAALALTKLFAAAPELTQSMPQELKQRASASLNKMLKLETACEDFDGVEIQYPKGSELAASLLKVMQ